MCRAVKKVVPVKIYPSDVKKVKTSNIICKNALIRGFWQVGTRIGKFSMILHEFPFIGNSAFGASVTRARATTHFRATRQPSARLGCFRFTGAEFSLSRTLIPSPHIPPVTRRAHAGKAAAARRQIEFRLRQSIRGDLAKTGRTVNKSIMSQRE